MANDFKFISTETDEIVSAMVSAYEQLVGRSVKPASPERLFITWAADVIVQTRELINYTGNQNIPSRASGENLDALAELFYQKTRPEAMAAQCSVTFTLSAAQSSTVIIPAGTRVTDPDRTLIWRTTENVQIPIGELTATVTVECQTAGTVGNGWSAGQISELVDVFPYYSSCVNVTTSDGGSEAATDAEFYAQLVNSEGAYSVAGSVAAYIYWAKTASSDIKDIQVRSPVSDNSQRVTVSNNTATYDELPDDTDLTSLQVVATTLVDEEVVSEGGSYSIHVYPGQVFVEDVDYTSTVIQGLDGVTTLTITLISPEGMSQPSLDIKLLGKKGGNVLIYGLMDDGSIPDAAMKAKIKAACSADDVRPLTDMVNVVDPSVVTYNIEFTYYLPSESDLSTTEIVANVAAAVAEYKAWQSGKLGRDINPSKLISLLMSTGIKRVDLVSPTFTALRDASDTAAPQIAALGTETITNGGLEDE